MLHLQCKLQFRTMPVDNSLPVTATETGEKFVDARTVQGITMEKLIPEVCKVSFPFEIPCF